MAIEQVEPANCVLWQFHERFGDELSDGFCKELITSMQRHGQRHPVLGRRIEGRGGAATELIYGARRLFAATKLGIKLLVDVRELDDRAAIVEMEIENRLRSDISPYERGMSYRRWLNARVFASQSELAKELGVSEAQVSRLLRYSELPAAVVAAFDSVRSIREEWAIALAKVCQDVDGRPRLMRRAREISQTERRSPPQVVYRRLLAGADSRGCETRKADDEVVRSSSGRPMYRIAVRTSAVHFIVPHDALSENLMQELKRQLTCMLEQVMREKTVGSPSYKCGTNRSRRSEAAGASA